MPNKTMSLQDFKDFLEAADAADRKVVDQCHKWQISKKLQNRISEMCAKFEAIHVTFGMSKNIDDMLLVGMYLVETYTYEMGREYQEEVLMVLAGKMNFIGYFADLEDEND